MSVKLRSQRFGSKKSPFYRIVATDSRNPRDGRFIEIVGTYNPLTNPATIKFDEEKVLSWLSKGAKPTDTVKSLLSKCENFDWYRYKTDIWYYFFFDREQYVAWIYIFITIVIALFIGFTYKKIYSKIKSILTKILYLVK